MHRNPLPATSFNKTALPISLALLDTLNNVLNKHTGLVEGHHTIHFSNKHYSAEHGGYHPVEIALKKDINNLYSILCITDPASMDTLTRHLNETLSSISLMPRSSLDTPA